MKEKFAITFLSQLTTYLTHLITTFLIFLKLGVYPLGTWTFLNSVVNLGFLFMNIGFDIVHLHYSGKKTSSEYFGTFFAINIILILINLVITLVLITILDLWSNSYLIILLILLLSKILFQIANTLFINLKSKLMIFRAEIPFFFISLAKSLSIIFLIFNLSYIFEPLIFISFSYLIFDLAFVILLVFFSKNEIKIIKPKKKLAYQYLKDAKPIIYFSIIYVIATNLGALIIKYSLGLEFLGYYSLINVYIITPLLMISGIFIQLSIVLYSSYFEKKDFQKIYQTTYILEKYFSIIYLTIIILIYLNGRLIFSIFLPDYMTSIHVLYIMIIIPFLVGITRPYSIPLISGKKLNIKYNISLFSHILIVILMIFFIPKQILYFKTLGLGLIGCALAQTIPWIFWMIINRYFSYKFFNLKPQKEIIFHVVLAFLSFLISFSLNALLLDKIIQNSIFLLIVLTIITISIFYSFLFIFQQLKIDDLKLFVQLFDFKNYRSSIHEEFSS